MSSEMGCMVTAVTVHSWRQEKSDKKYIVVVMCERTLNAWHLYVFMDHCPQVLHFGWRLHWVSKAEWILGLLHGSHFSGLTKFLDFPVIFFIFPVFFLNVLFFKPKTWSILVSLKIIINICLTFSDFSSLFKMSWRENAFPFSQVFPVRVGTLIKREKILTRYRLVMK